MQKLFENFHIFQFQKKIIAVETIRVNTVPQNKFNKFIAILITPIRKSKSHTTTHFGDIFFVLLKVMAMWERHSFFFNK